MQFDADDLWRFLPWGYLFSIAVETPVLLALLSKRHSLRDRLLAGVWLTACSYPIVILVMPLAMNGWPNWVYLAVAETFAPASECLLFWLVWIRGREPDRAATCRDMIAVTLANLASFGFGEALYACGYSFI